MRRLADQLDRTGVVTSDEVGPEAAPTETEDSLASVWPTRTLTSSLLKPGMQLVQDLETQEGMLLLSKDLVLDEALIRKIRYFETRLGRRFGARSINRPQTKAGMGRNEPKRVESSNGQDEIRSRGRIAHE